LAEKEKLPVRLRRCSTALLLTTTQIRIYGMTHFDENFEYWGDKIKPIIGAANGRFTARSVKIFGDGKSSSPPEPSTLNTILGALRSGGAAVSSMKSECSFGLMAIVSYTSLTLTIPAQGAS
jgi:hypothetical protein